MLLLRLIAFLLICYVVVIVIRSLIGRGAAASRLKHQADGEDMVLDPQCRSYVPKSDAVMQSGRYFCSQECARLYLTR